MAKKSNTIPQELGPAVNGPRSQRDDSQVVFQIADDNTDDVIGLWRQWLNARAADNDEALAGLDAEIRNATPTTFEGALCQIRIVQARESVGPVNSSDDLAKALGHLSRLGGGTSNDMEASRVDTLPVSISERIDALETPLGDAVQSLEAFDRLAGDMFAGKPESILCVDELFQISAGKLIYI
jgi:hypothetical protein